MTYPAYTDSGEVGSVHLAAICKELGERIWSRQDRDAMPLPPRLFDLMERLRSDPSWNSPGSGA
jgi:hypothetical protein